MSVQVSTYSLANLSTLSENDYVRLQSAFNQCQYSYDKHSKLMIIASIVGFIVCAILTTLGCILTILHIGSLSAILTLHLSGLSIPFLFFAIPCILSWHANRQFSKPLNDTQLRQILDQELQLIADQSNNATQEKKNCIWHLIAHRNLFRDNERKGPDYQIACSQITEEEALARFRPQSSI